MNLVITDKEHTQKKSYYYASKPLSNLCFLASLFSLLRLTFVCWLLCIQLQKVVVKLGVHNDKEKQRAMKAASSLAG